MRLQSLQDSADPSFHNLPPHPNYAPGSAKGVPPGGAKQTQGGLQHSKSQSHFDPDEQVGNSTATRLKQCRSATKLLDTLKQFYGVLGRVEAVLFFVLHQPLIGLASLIKRIAHHLRVLVSGPEVIFTVHDKERQIELVNPKVLVNLGGPSAKTLLNTTEFFYIY